MCGLTGYWSTTRADTALIKRMGLTLKHRGPDGSGIFINEDKTLAIAHRRLSIIDVSEAGHQPMVSFCKRFVLSYNGEIYNHLEIRKELKDSGYSCPWSGYSDTETLLAALIHWGIPSTLRRLNGMFAFALWDGDEKTLTLARDRMGEKPMYYGMVDNTFFFGSELSSFKPHPNWTSELNRDVVSLYLRHNYVPDPWSIYSGIKKVAPAHYVVVSNNGKNISDQISYWSLLNQLEFKNHNSDKTPTDYVDELHVLLKDATLKRLMSDVPLGAFLSGGTDSSLIVSLMQEASSTPVKTFTIGFHEQGYNEAVHAKKIAAYLGTEHTELYVSSEEALAVIPKLSQVWDEPFADSSQIPTLLLSELTKNQVSVSLTGDGGDELYCGYSRYTQSYRMWKELQYIPMPLRRMLSRLLMVLPGVSIERLMSVLPSQIRIPHMRDRLPKLSELIREDSFGKFYRHQMSLYNDPKALLVDGCEPKSSLSTIDDLPRSTSLLERMMFTDCITYLPGDILTKVDRASMAVGLEARVPLLDHRVVEFAWNTPMDLKYCNGEGKQILKKVLQRYIPNEMFDRPKKGFSVPIEEWLRGPLHEWTADVLNSDRLKREGIFQADPIQKMLREHSSGKRRWHHQLWNILMFQSWLDSNK